MNQQYPKSFLHATGYEAKDHLQTADGFLFLFLLECSLEMTLACHRTRGENAI